MSTEQQGSVCQDLACCSGVMGGMHTGQGEGWQDSLSRQASCPGLRITLRERRSCCQGRPSFA